MAVVAIGNELLSGKVRDRNVHYLARELRALGATLTRVVLCPDELPAIVDALHWAAAHAATVITTGGVGPTHDDVTLAAVAAYLGVDRARDPGFAAAIARYFGARANDDVLAMADVPRGATLLRPVRDFLPIVVAGPIHVFPGEPGALVRLFDAWKEALRQPPFWLLRLELDADEGELSPLLRRLAAAHPEVDVGSYPRFDAGAPYRLLVTVEAKDEPAVARAGAALRAAVEGAVGPAAVLRVDGPRPPATDSAEHAEPARARAGEHSP